MNNTKKSTTFYISNSGCYASQIEVGEQVIARQKKKVNTNNDKNKMRCRIRLLLSRANAE